MFSKTWCDGKAHGVFIGKCLYIVNNVFIWLATLTGDTYVAEYNLDKRHGKVTHYLYGKIWNYLYDDGKFVAEAIVKEDWAFFTRDGEVKTAFDKDTYKNNLDGWMSKTAKLELKQMKQAAELEQFQMQQAADDLKAAEQLKAYKLKLEQEQQPGTLAEATEQDGGFAEVTVKPGGLAEIETPIVQESKCCLMFWMNKLQKIYYDWWMNSE